MPVLAPGFRDIMRKPAIRGILDTATLEDLPAPEMLGALSMPVLLLWGQSERIFPASSLSYFRRYLPAHALVEEPAGFGHCPHFDDPRRLVSRVIAFAKGALVANRAA
jgi:pimeloyl-ACP methyl ester carboxylesterase